MSADVHGEGGAGPEMIEDWEVGGVDIRGGGGACASPEKIEEVCGCHCDSTGGGGITGPHYISQSSMPSPPFFWQHMVRYVRVMAQEWAPWQGIRREKQAQVWVFSV